MNIVNILNLASVIPVLEVPTLDKAAPLAQALDQGGLRVVELTLRTSCALKAVKEMQEAAPDLIIGMGTIRSRQDIDAALDAGAKFLVSPGASHSLLSALSTVGAPALPGVATASEAMTAQEAGFVAQKFFPAEAAGGVSYLKSLSGPLPDITFCPTGGISSQTARDYLALANVACVGGSWIASKDDIAREDWSKIQANAEIAADMQS